MPCDLGRQLVASSILVDYYCYLEFKIKYLFIQIIQLLLRLKLFFILVDYYCYLEFKIKYLFIQIIQLLLRLKLFF